MKLLEIFNKENAQVDLDQINELLEKFFSVALSELKLKTLPKFSIHKTVGDPDYPSFGGYDFENNVLYVAIANRHIVDILRTIAHELVHYSQNLNGGLSVDDGITGSEKENQANAVAGVILRKFNKRYPEYLSVKPILVEKWSQKYKRSINCNNPKGFSQRAYCQGRKKRVKENFADGRNPGRKGLSRRVGIPKKATLDQLEKIVKSSTGERRRMAQWQINMRRGKK